MYHLNNQNFPLRQEYFEMSLGALLDHLHFLDWSAVVLTIGGDSDNFKRSGRGTLWSTKILAKLVILAGVLFKQCKARCVWGGSGSLTVLIHTLLFEIWLLKMPGFHYCLVKLSVLRFFFLKKLLLKIFE